MHELQIDWNFITEYQLVSFGHTESLNISQYHGNNVKAAFECVCQLIISIFVLSHQLN